MTWRCGPYYRQHTGDETKALGLTSEKGSGHGLPKSHPSVPVGPGISDGVAPRTKPPTMEIWMGILLANGDTRGGAREGFPEHRDTRSQ